MKKLFHIVMVEPSDMVSEGLSVLLIKSGLKCNITMVNSLDELVGSNKKRKCHIAVVNPLYIQNNEKLFIQIKNQCEDTVWIALIYAFFDNQILSHFDDSISISDTPESINYKLKKYQNQPETDLNQQPNTLSERELDVLKLLASGLANKEIADKLHISVNTVITHRKNITHKTGIKTVSGLTIYAVVKKLINPDNFST